MALKIVAFAAIACAAPAGAQVYKWVDENGSTHYSDQPPPGRSAGTKVGIIADRLSVYTPDPALTRAAAPAGDTALSERIDRLERQLQAEREARQLAAAAEAQASTAAYEQCLADRRVDCDGYDRTYPYGAPIVVVALRHRRFPRAIAPRVRGFAGNIVET